jgi:hypothetical protein
VPLSDYDVEFAEAFTLTTVYGETVTFRQARCRRVEPSGELIEIPTRRHDAQLNEIQRALEGEGLDPRQYEVIGSPELAKPFDDRLSMEPKERYRLYRVGLGDPKTPVSISGKPLFGRFLFLFNVFVALEWRPSRETLARIATGATAASNFLYEATDGQMAVGQVTIGGPEFMQAADIQIMASTRFLPRSWMNGLNNEIKFSPIRLGRGLWSKNRSAVIFWDAPEGYRTIIHEWGHYALNLLDEYVSGLAVTEDLSRPPALRERKLGDELAYKLFVPYISQPVESIMSTLEGTSKIMPDRLDIVKEKLEENYPGVDLIVPSTPGPYELPLSLPVFYGAPSLKLQDSAEDFANDQWGEEATISARALDLDGEDPGHCWLYLLRLKPVGDNLTLERVIPQGSLEAQGKVPPTDQQDHPIFGAIEGDILYAVWYANGRLKAKSGPVRRVSGSRPGARRLRIIADWDDPMPADQMPLVTVLPADREGERGRSNQWSHYDVKVRIVGAAKPASVWLAEPGRAAEDLKLSSGRANGRPYWEVYSKGGGSRRQLDGVVVARWTDGVRNRFWLADYSHGGGPPTSSQGGSGGGAPITAGSSEGNILIYFPQEEKPQEAPNGQAEPAEQNVKIVTTRNFGDFPKASASGVAISYTFSVAANQQVPSKRSYKGFVPTLAMFFDREALPSDNPQAGEEMLLIHRWNPNVGKGGAWKPLPTFVAAGRFYAATPLNRFTAPNLTKTDAELGGATEAPAKRIEYYQLRRVPVPAQSGVEIPNLSVSTGGSQPQT